VSKKRDRYYWQLELNHPTFSDDEEEEHGRHCNCASCDDFFSSDSDDDDDCDYEDIEDRPSFSGLIDESPISGPIEDCDADDIPF